MIPFSDLESVADRVRREAVIGAIETDWGHLASSLSTVNILVALMVGVMGKNDYLLLSKGHGCYGLYALLSALDRCPVGWVDRFGHGACCYDPERGIMAGTGSLGHGLPIAAGLALAFDRNVALRHHGHVWCVIGDGEAQEGSIAEALGFIDDHSLRGISIVVDSNGFGALCAATPGDPFLYYTVTDNGAMHLASEFRKRRQLYAVKTVKGAGVPFMEGRKEFHFRRPSEWTTEQRSWVDSWLSSTPTTTPS